MEQSKPSREASAGQDVQEFVVRIPKDKHKHFNVMKFNGSLKVDVAKWRTQGVKMERENNYKEFKLDEDMPKYGAGSEFGRDLKEEARRKKHGILVKQYNPDDQPWILKVGGKGGKKFKGIREGGVTENASYYVFTQATDGTFEAHPVEEWYNFTPIQCFKALTAEEAEEEFGRRDKVLNYFTIMVKKKLQADAGEEDDDEEKKAGGKKKKKKPQKDFKISDMDEWMHDLDDDSGESGNEEDDEDQGKPKKSAKKGGKKKKKENKSDDEAMEESDEGDFDDKEVDYITSSSGSEEEIGEEEKANRELKGVEDEDALRKLMSDEEEEEAEEENKETEEANESKEKVAEQKTKQKQKKSDDTSGESSSDSSDSDFDEPKFTSAIFVPQNAEKTKKKSGSDNSAGSSRANTPTKPLGDKDGSKAQKRRFPEPLPSSNKRPKVQSTSDGAMSSNSSLEGINVETVRRYLQRKPMTASELLRKFKSKKTKMSSDQLVNKITDVLKKIPLQKTNIKGKMYLSLKTT